MEKLLRAWIRIGITVAFFTVCPILPACLADKEPETHSLYYVYIALSQPVSAPGIFEFIAMGLLDDRKIDYYDSVHKAKVSQQDWMTKKFNASYWQRGSSSRKSKEVWFNVNVKILMERMKHNTRDIHSLVWRHGCEAFKRPDGSLQFVKGVDQYSYDGLDFLYFDVNKMQWVAPVPAALPTKQTWDLREDLNNYTKNYLQKQCVDWLDKFLTYSKENRSESQKLDPKVHLLTKLWSPGRYRLTCLATGFYPKDIKISILKNDWPEVDGHQDDVLPNGDGTHQIRLTFIVEKLEIHMYRCKVEHRTLDKPLIVEWKTAGQPPLDEDTPSSLPIGAIVGGVVGLLLLIVTGLAFTAFAKKKKKSCFGRTGSEPQPDSQENEEEVPLNDVRVDEGIKRSNSDDSGLFEGSCEELSLDNEEDDTSGGVTPGLHNTIDKTESKLNDPLADAFQDSQVPEESPEEEAPNVKADDCDDATC